MTVSPTASATGTISDASVTFSNQVLSAEVDLTNAIMLWLWLLLGAVATQPPPSWDVISAPPAAAAAAVRAAAAKRSVSVTRRKSPPPPPPCSEAQ